jgi:hypothetical protein
MRCQSLANGISAAGSGVFGLIFSLATGAVIDKKYWSRMVSQASQIHSPQRLSRDRNAIVRPPQLAFDSKLSLQIRCVAVAELGIHQHAWLYSAAFLTA